MITTDKKYNLRHGSCARALGVALAIIWLGSLLLLMAVLYCGH